MKKALLITASALAIAIAGVTPWLMVLAADPEGEKDCMAGLPDVPALKPVADKVAEPRWAQRGGTVNDASCLSRTEVAGVVRPRSEAEVGEALAYARAKGLTVSAAGVKHSMGGQAFRKGGVMLDMRSMNAIRLDAAARTITVGAGATWHDIQNAIHPRFAVKSMQSTDIFTVGGSISVNAHGMDHQAGALMRSIRSLRVMLADGSIVTASREVEPDLFRHVVGGYGLFGLILSAELEVVPNDIYRSERQLIGYRDFPEVFAKLQGDPGVGLTYTHLSTAPGSLLQEALVYSYHKVDGAGLVRPPLSEVASTKMRRLTINLAKRGNLFASFKWWSEKNLEHRFESCTVTRAQASGSGEACLVSRNDPMHDSVAYLRNNLPRETDILHEYFIPRDRLIPFVDGMRALFREQKTNLLNASIRVVDTEDNALSYAPAPAFSVVLYINQPVSPEGQAAMAKITSDLIDLSAANGGRFFLPYQLHYTPAQLERSYPEIRDFFAAKRKWDPGEAFSNSWYARYAPAFSAPASS
ncbi:FAD-dependent oxidoreductase [Sphingomonas canadensis]|uniref:FAD-dependent oxidoreductase n=1 Tax=Sphingomonas canadensis TaxID=1219257 RepID=A0ABW3HAW1_9SPHN|nr:FAD-binding oxidoreductase [Sphingomonas canadensis]MCW3838263.1 FAD-binding oxidoreductase [Sphingomonas canadensis]